MILKSLAVFVALSLPASGQGNLVVWHQPAFGVFGSGSSWAAGAAPGQGDTALFGATLPTTQTAVTVLFLVDEGNGDTVVESGEYVFRSGNPGVTYALTGRLDLGPRMSAFDPGLPNHARLTVDMDGTLVTGEVRLGNDRLANGTRPGWLDIRGQSRVRSTFVAVGDSAGAVGDVVIRGPGARWEQSGNLTIGSAGTGTCRIEGGATVATLHTVFGGFLGIQPGSSGTLVVTDPGSRWDLTNNLSIGRDGGTGSLTVQNSGSVTGLHAFIGVFNGSHGTATVRDQGSRWALTTGLTVATTGTAELVIENQGEVLVGQWVVLGQDPGAAGEAAVDGARLTIGGELSVGRGGNGRLRLENGAVARAAFASAGTFAGADGAVEVRDSTSSFTGELSIGRGGNGQLSIELGDVDAAFGSVGTFADASGLVVVADGTLTLQSEFSVGRGGYGELTVMDGGRVEAAFGSVGTFPGSEGIVVIDGSGSQWDVTGDLAIGAGGPADVTVVAGGQLQAGRLLLGALARVGGQGRLAADVVNGGVVAPGDAVGRLSIEGAYDQASTATLEIELRGRLNDVLTVTGTATLDGTLSVKLLPGTFLRPGAVITVVEAGSINGAFSRLDVPEGMTVLQQASVVLLRAETTIHAPRQVGWR